MHERECAATDQILQVGKRAPPAAALLVVVGLVIAVMIESL
jgi:hypothetical protein